MVRYANAALSLSLNVSRICWSGFGFEGSALDMGTSSAAVMGIVAMGVSPS